MMRSIDSEELFGCMYNAWSYYWRTDDRFIELYERPLGVMFGLELLLMIRKVIHFSKLIVFGTISPPRLTSNLEYSCM